MLRTTGELTGFGVREVRQFDPFVVTAAIGQIAAQGLAAIQAVAVGAAVADQRQRLGHDHLGAGGRDGHVARRSCAASLPVCGPAAITTASQPISPWSVRTAVTLPDWVRKPVTVVC